QSGRSRPPRPISMDRKRLLKNPLLWLVVAIAAFFVISTLTDENRDYTAVPTSQAMQQISADNVKEAVQKDREQEILLTLKEPIEVDGQPVGKIISQYPAGAGEDLVNQLVKNNTKTTSEVTQDSIWGQLLIYMIPLGLLLLLLFWMMNNAQGGGNRVLNFGKSKAKQLSKDMPKTTFDDVAGADEAVEELEEVKGVLQNPARYTALGAKVPKGVLLCGPPGTGKTLLARAVAGEAGVPFYTIAGSDVVEMFVGVGASRVRDLFEQAKANSPAIIFVGELDAVGRHPGPGLAGGHAAREPTRHPPLAAMDGFEGHT